MFERSNEGCRVFVFAGAGLLPDPYSPPVAELPDGIPVTSMTSAMGVMNWLENSA